MQRWAWPILGLFVVACFWGFWSYGPFDLDEGLYSVAMMEMQERGDWVVPTYRGAPFFEKPILFYWTAWIVDLICADGVAALRLPSFLATIGTLSLVALFTRRIGAVMILSVSVLFMGVGRMFMPDPILVFGMTLALLSFWKSRDDERWHLATGVGLAISVLAKGPMPLIVFILLFLYCHVRMGRRNSVKKTQNASGKHPLRAAPLWLFGGIILFLGAVLPWYLTVSVKSPTFISEFLVRQNFGRLTGAGDSMHFGQFWFYIPIIVIGLLPFSLSLVGAWTKREGEFEHYLWAFVWIVFVLFSLAGSKLPHYMLPVFPPLAIFLERYLSRSERVRWEYVGILFLGFVGLAVASLLVDWLPVGHFAWVLALTTFMIIVLFSRLEPKVSSVSLGFLAMAPITLSCLLLGPKVYWNRTHLPAIQVARAADQTGLRIVEYRTGGERQSGKTSHPSMQWTLGRNTEATEDLDKLAKMASTGALAVITRGNRLESDLQYLQPRDVTFEKIFRSGEFQLFVVKPAKVDSG